MKREYDLDELARNYGFSVRVMEKVCRISDLVEDISYVRFLRDRLSLYGGTALSFIHFEELLRLSIDLDFNYRHVDTKDWGEVRKDIDRKIKDVLYRQGYRESDLAISPTYPLVRITVRYSSSQGLRDNFKVEIGYIRRYPILKEDVLAAFKHIGTQERFPIKTPKREELFANKWCALLYRRTSRDLFDVYQIMDADMDITVFRKCAVVDSLMRGKPKLYEINIDEAIKKIAINSSLKNLLQAEKFLEFDFKQLAGRVADFSRSVMKSLTKNEIKAIDRFFELKTFEPDLIDEEGIFHEELKNHPSILWALNRRV